MNLVTLNFSLSPKGRYLAIFLKDRSIRLFEFKTGKLLLTINENIKIAQEIQDNPSHPDHDLVVLGKN